MTTANLTPCYRIHLTRIDGEAIHTPTGTLTFDHAYTRRNGKVYNPASIERKYNKGQNWRGYEVSEIEVYYFNPEAWSRALYFSKDDLKTVAADLGLATVGARSALCYRIARHLKA